MKDVRLNCDRWVRHRCDGTRALGYHAYFNDSGVRITELPGATRGCPFCWRDYLSLRGEWFEKYAPRSPSSPPDEVARAASDLVARLGRRGFPEGAICSHHGVFYQGLINSDLQLTSAASDKLQVSVGKPCYRRPAEWYDIRLEAVAVELGSSILDSWGGGDRKTAVLSICVPQALLRGIKNYRNLPSPFNLSEENKARFQDFDDWLWG